MPSKLSSGNRFLVVPQKELSKDSIAKKARRDKESAEKRAPIVNEEISRRRQSASDYARQAQNTYNGTAWQGRDYNIARTVNTIKDAANVVANPFTPSSVRNQNSNSYSYGGGQFAGVAQQARQIYEEDTAFDPTNPDSWHKLGQRRAKGESEVHRGLRDVYLKNGLSDDEHRRIIGKGEDILGGKLVEDWLDFGGIQTEEDLRKAEARYKEYKQYMDRYYIERSFYNSDSGQFETHYCILSSAPLPPWVKATAQNINEWDYYRGFQSETGNILHDQAMALFEEQEKYRKT